MAHRVLPNSDARPANHCCACLARPQAGECEGKLHVKRLCPVSCGLCKVHCADLNEHCGSWATDGECEKSPDFMMVNCPTSCGICKPSCVDLDKARGVAPQT